MNGEEALKQHDSLYVSFFLDKFSNHTNKRDYGEAAAEAETVRERDWRVECAAVYESESEKCGCVGYVG